jgi:hypothetical protein
MLVKAAAYAGAELEGTADGDGGGEEDHPQGPSLALVRGRLLIPDLGLRRLIALLAAAPMMPKQRLRYLGRRAAAGGTHHRSSTLDILRDPHYRHGPACSHTGSEAVARVRRPQPWPGC